ncbi:hypothetical protein Gste01_00275 [Geobacillus stearothermophilus ATCC 7953]
MCERTILIVDDEEEMRLLVSMYLENAGFRCLEAGDGGRRWRCFRNIRLMPCCWTS